MILQSLFYVFLWLLTADANSEFSALFYKKSYATKNQTNLCSDSEIIQKWSESVRVSLGTQLSQDLNKTTKAAKWRRKNPVVVKLSNKRRRKTLVRIIEETEYKIDVMNKLPTKAEFLLIIDFENKTECGVGAFTKEELNKTETVNNTDSTKCLSIESSVEPRRRTSYPFVTPKCGCFTFRYHIAFNKENTTLIKTPDPSSPKQHKKLTKTFCIQNTGEEDSRFDPRPFKKHERRRGKKGFFKKNRNRHRRPKKFGRKMKKLLSRSKKDVFQIWSSQDQYHPLYNSTDNKGFNENEYIVDNEIRTNAMYPIDGGLIQSNESEDLDEYEDESEVQRNLEDEEEHLIEGYEYEDESAEDEIRNINDYENEDVGEDDYDYGDDEDVDEGDNVDDDVDDDDDSDEESNEIDQIDNDNNDADESIIDDENENKDDKNSSCESDESEESSEEDVEEDENDNNDDNDNQTKIYETKFTKNSIHSGDSERSKLDILHKIRNYSSPRPNLKRKSYRVTYNNGIRHGHRFPRRRVYDMGTRRQRQPFKPFKPWKLSNRAKWQRKQRINENSLKALAICCRQGVNRKRHILHNRLENNFDFNETCEEISTKFSLWVQDSFNVTEKFCFEKFRSCCNNWSLLSGNFRLPYIPMRRNVLY